MLRLTRRALSVKFTPLNKQVLLERINPATETKSGILIPQKAQQKTNEGVVVAVANATEGKEAWTPSVKNGDRVLLREWGGQTVKLEDKEYVLMREDDLLGVLSD